MIFFIAAERGGLLGAARRGTSGNEMEGQVEAKEKFAAGLSV